MKKSVKSFVKFSLSIQIKFFWKKREPKKGKEQYEKQSEQSELFEVGENGLRFYVNLSDYVDTGLFLDHRITRDLVRKESKGKKILKSFFLYRIIYRLRGVRWSYKKPKRGSFQHLFRLGRRKFETERFFTYKTPYT
ncbi:S-adenosylmethionine-dependent methyltransferase domain protein [Leptospira interrogans serovar Canicola]|nr:S-adenosylmethionine-dependent methyltransferase domain protein [Leptospira interrogans serovar Canicola]